VLTRCDAVEAPEVEKIVSEVRRIAGQVGIARTVHAPLDLWNGERTENIEILRGTPVAAFCGIGNPAAFRRTLEGMGADVRAFREFPDHYAYHREDVDDLQQWAAKYSEGTSIVTTQKDWVK